MSITLNNVTQTDLVELFTKIRRLSELKARGNDTLTPFIITESEVDAQMIFDFLYKGASLLADKTRSITSDTQSGFEALRERFLNFDYSNIEVINFPSQEGGIQKRDVQYEYAFNALIHLALSDWYKGCGVYDIANVEEAEAFKYANLLSDNSRTTKLFKAPFVPAW